MLSLYVGDIMISWCLSLKGVNLDLMVGTGLALTKLISGVEYLLEWGELTNDDDGGRLFLFKSW